MKRTSFLLLTTIVLLASSLSAAAQKFQPKTIQFKGAPEYSDQELLAAAGMQKGTVLAFADMKDHSQKLMDTGVFESLSFKFDGVDLVFTLVPHADLYPIRLENLPLTPGKELDAALHDRFPLYHGKVPSEGGLTESVRGALEEMLAAKGIKATVMATPYTDQIVGKVMAMSFAITAPPVRVGEIHLEGVSTALEAQADHAANHETGTPFDTEASAHNLEHALELFYTDQGYAAVKVHAARSGAPVISDAAIDIPFTVSVAEGRLYKLGAIHLPADSLATQAEIDKAIGQRASATQGQDLRDLLFLIASRYKSKGYMDCALTPHPEFDEAAGTVSYTVEIHPGAIYHLGFVKFDNVSDELRSHLMRVWQIMPGDPFDESYLAGFISNAQKNDPVLMRSLSGVGATYQITADQQTHQVNCVLHFVRLKQAQ